MSETNVTTMTCPQCGAEVQVRQHTTIRCLLNVLDQRDEARELAAMYLQCLNSRALERGETVEEVAWFCESEFQENRWLKEAYEKLSETEAAVKSFLLRSKGFE